MNEADKGNRGNGLGRAVAEESDVDLTSLRGKANESPGFFLHLSRKQLFYCS